MPRMTHAEYLSFLSRSRRVADPYERIFGLKTDQKETGKGGVQDQIEQWLKSFGNRCFYVRSRTDKPSTSQIGNADFIGWMRPGGSWHSVICFAAEVKRKGQKPTLQQMARLKQAECAGAIVGIVHSLQEMKSLLKMD